MEIILIGSYIRQKREDRGWTLQQLCEGICAVSTLSRIETNSQVPSLSVVRALLERLGLPAGRFFALLSDNDIAEDSLKKKLHNDKIRFRRAAEPDRAVIRKEIMADLEALEKLGGKDSRLIQQLVLSTKITISRLEGSLPPDKRLDLLLEAIRLTIPRFNLKKFSSFQYTAEELMIINQIARTYAQMGDRKKAIGISRRLLQYIDKNNQRLDHYPRQFCLIAHNCAIDLCLTKQYDKAISLAEKGWKVCVEQGEYQFLPGFLAILAECWYFLEDREKSTELYHQAYTLYKTFGDQSNLATMKREMKERLGLEPPYENW